MSATATVQFAVNNVPLCFNANAQYSVYGKIYSHRLDNNNKSCGHKGPHDLLLLSSLWFHPF